MLSNEYGEAAVEVLDILDNTNKSDVNKIPLNFIKFLVEIASEDYKVNLDHSKTINEMNLREKTKEILGYIYINWWCSPKDKEKYMKQIKELEIKIQEEIKEKYNPNKIFENTNERQDYKEVIKESIAQNGRNSMAEYNGNIFKKIWDKILNIFRK